MTNDFNPQDVRYVIASQLGKKVEEVTDEKRLMEDLGADSLDAVELIMEIEHKFGLEISDKEAEKLRTVGQTIYM
jgi:acyl carrier protein